MLGVVDVMRFINQFRAGDDDYTAEHVRIFNDNSVKSIVAKIKARRNNPA